MKQYCIPSIAFLCIASAALADDGRSTKPNIVLFLVDDMGWMDCGAYGSKYYETPNIDRFARRALRFTDAYACPLCSPTRASLMSGKYSARHGITSATGHQPPQPAGFAFLPDTAPPNAPLVMPMSKNYLEPAEFTLAEALRDAGYRTAHIGKWHLGMTPPYWPEAQGFHVAFHCHPDPGPPSYFSPYSVLPSGEPKPRVRIGTITDGPPGEYIVDRLADEATRFIADNRDRPFFLNLWQYGVHGPWGHKEEVTKHYAGRTDPRGKQGNPIMASMLKSVDDSFGRVLDKLDELGLADRTIVIFMSDNGGNTHSNVPGTGKTERQEETKSAQMQDWRKWAGDRPPTNNEPLRDGKGSLYEGGTRVPLMVAGPGIGPVGTTCSQVVGAVDIYPTVLDLLGVSKSPAQKIDGVSFAPLLNGAKQLDRQAYFNFFPHGGPSRPPGVWVRSGDWKLIRWFMTSPQYPDRYELYNLRDDLSETKNLAEAMPERLQKLDALIDGFLRDTGALVPKANPAYRPAGSTTKAGVGKPLGGWQPKGCQADVKDGALVVTGENRNPFLGISGLKLAGPVEFRLRVRGAGAGKIQWRTSDQETFPAEGQVTAFEIPRGNGLQDVIVRVPVQGTLLHCRIYLPAQSQPVLVEAIEMRPTDGRPLRWDFGK